MSLLRQLEAAHGVPREGLGGNLEVLVRGIYSLLALCYRQGWDVSSHTFPAIEAMTPKLGYLIFSGPT